jgi:hypothetical protein
MKLQIKGYVLKTEQWTRDKTKRDIFIQEYTSKDEMILLCMDSNKTLIRKCKRNKKLLFFLDIKTYDFGSYKRNYLILENVVAIT